MVVCIDHFFFNLNPISSEIVEKTWYVFSSYIIHDDLPVSYSQCFGWEQQVTRDSSVSVQPYGPSLAQITSWYELKLLQSP